MTQTQNPDVNVDVERFIELLNEDLGTEFQSIVQYTNHIATITGAEYLAVLDELKVHLGQELTHAQVLAEQVSFLGGEPSTLVPPVERSQESRVALKADLRLETDQLERYRVRSRAGDRAQPARRGRSPAAPARADPGARARPADGAGRLTACPPSLDGRHAPLSEGG